MWSGNYSSRRLTGSTFFQQAFLNCNCVWLVDDQGMQVRLNANGQTARVPLPVSILANVSSGLLRTYELRKMQAASPERLILDDRRHTLLEPPSRTWPGRFAEP